MTKKIFMRNLQMLVVLLLFVASCTQTRTSSNDGNAPLTDEQLLDSVQYRFFQYFWDGAEPNSGMARERFHVDGNYPQNDMHVVTTGGSGFGVMAILVGIERGFITREEGLQRLLQIVKFLENADRFHGVWPHWLNGETGRVQPFSQYDDGGDLVETSFLIHGLLAVKEYFQDGDVVEKELAAKIERLWREVEWNWYTKNGENVLYWHWSPNHEWRMNHRITGYNECLITYILAASSPTYAILPDVYHEGWAQGGDIAEAYSYYGYTLELKHHGDPNKGGPLFWAHYSYLGLDPRGLIDKYANYWDLNVAHTLINRQHCIENPHGYAGYGENSWGLTASYSVPGAVQYFEGRTDEKPEKGITDRWGYAAHHPALDLGVISPTAALSSFPYAPEEVMQVIRHFYENLGDKIWGEYGFYDAFSEEYEWYPQRYLAIDQGPVPVMIENHRSALLWNLFMQNGDVQRGLNQLGFKSPHFN
jgi:hypothetical protein